MSIKEKASDLYNMIATGQTMEALDKYYHDDVVVHDNASPIRNGKEEQRAAIQQWFQMVKEFHGAGVKALSADEETGVAMVESWNDITMHEGGRMKMEEVAVQKWENGKIVHERFYYQMDPMPQQ